MPSLRHSVSLWTLCLCFACDQQTEPAKTEPARAEPAKADDPPADTKAKAPTESESTEDKHDTSRDPIRAKLRKPEKITNEQRRAAAKLVNEGRTLSKKKKLAEALTAFEAAMKANPSSATAACEAGYAALRLDKLDQAQRDLELGLQLVQQPNKEAACRYNLGLVAEKRGEAERAVEHYKHSLRLRDNKTVRTKLAKLSPDGTCLPPERVIDEAKVACGLPDDYWECGRLEDQPIDEELDHKPQWFLEKFSDPEPLAPDTKLEAMATMFGMWRSRVDLTLALPGRRLLLAEIGWTTTDEDPSTVTSVRYDHRDLIAGGPTEVVVTVEQKLELDLHAALMRECEDKFDFDSPQFDACNSKEPKEDFEVRMSTLYLGCGQLEGRWVCAPSETEPKTEDDFMALFRCG